MKVEIKRIETYEITYKGEKLGDFKEVDEWNGMVQLKDPRGGMIIIRPDGGINRLFDRLFNDKEAKSVSAIIMSKDVIEKTSRL